MLSVTLSQSKTYFKLRLMNELNYRKLLKI